MRGKRILPAIIVIALIVCAIVETAAHPDYAGRLGKKPTLPMTPTVDLGNPF